MEKKRSFNEKKKIKSNNIFVIRFSDKLSLGTQQRAHHLKELNL